MNEDGFGMKHLGIIGAFLLFMNIGCSILESRGGSLIISLHHPDSSGVLAKPGEQLRTVQVRLNKGDESIYWGFMDKQDDYFYYSMPSLEAGRDYSVLLHGKGSENWEVICCAFENDIEIRTREETTVYLEWQPYISQLITPVDGDSVDSDSLTFVWSSVRGTEYYYWALDVDRTFWPVEKTHVVEGTSYTIAMTDLTPGAYYWKVRCYTRWRSSGGLANTDEGPWSEISGFIIR